jgi:hypothetical protein
MKTLTVALVIGSVLMVSSPSWAQQIQKEPKSTTKHVLRWVGVGLIGLGGLTVLSGATDKVSVSEHTRTIMMIGGGVAAAGAVTLALSADKKNFIEVGPRQVQIVRKW